jgi:hypothetical protein
MADLAQAVERTGSVYYDQYTLLTQLGYVQPIPAAASRQNKTRDR